MQAKGDVQIAEQDSLVSGTLYMAGREHQDLLNEVYASYAHTNPLHTDVFPSLRTLEAEVIAMTASLVGGQHPLPVCCERASHFPPSWTAQSYVEHVCYCCACGQSKERIRGSHTYVINKLPHALKQDLVHSLLHVVGLGS